MSENKKSENIDEKLEDKVEEMVEEKIEEKLKEEKKKSKNPLVIVVIVLVIALLATLGYIAYDKGLIFSNKKNDVDVTDKDNNKDQKDENKVVQLDVNDSLVTDTYKKVVQYTVPAPYFTNSRVKASDLSNETVTYLSLNNAMTKYGKANVTKEQMEKIVHSVFGKNYDFEHVYYPNNNTELRYNPDTGVYEYQFDQICGGSMAPGDFKKVIAAYKDSTTLTLEVGVLFVYDTFTELYKDYDHTIRVTDFEKSESGYPTDTIENAKKGTLYKMVFTLEDGNYVYSYTEPMNK